MNFLQFLHHFTFQRMDGLAALGEADGVVELTVKVLPTDVDPEIEAVASKGRLKCI
jgi:hypothetical protein